MNNTVKSKILLFALLLVAVAGIGAYIYQLINGLGVTGMSNGTSWGMYIINFMFFVGLSAGGLIVASSASVFGIEKYKKVALPAVIVSTVCIVLAGLFVLIDLGGIQRFLNIITSPSLTSPLVWDIIIITVYLVIDILYLVWLSKGEEKAHSVKVLGWVALPTAILVHSVTAWIFGLQIAQEGWYSTIMAPLFVASALDSGLALLLICLIAFAALKWIEFDKDLMKSLSGLLAVFIAVDFFFLGCEVLTMAYPGTEGASAVLAQMFIGSTAPFFWFEIFGGIIIPFIILVIAKNRENKALVAVASALVVIGVFCKRFWLLITSFTQQSIVGGPGVLGGSSSAVHGTGTSIWTNAITYCPTWVEYLIVAGVICLGIATIAILGKKLLNK